MKALLKAAIAAVLILPFVHGSASAATGPVVRTAEGKVLGSAKGGLEVYRSIPYAAPPTGTRRFRPPVRHAGWKGTKDTRTRGPACVQTPEYDPTENGLDVQSEDCLTLNVWTPRSDHRRRPVLVFIHGGAFGWGSARNTFLDGSALARRGDAVVVTIQYRLGAFGFTELSDRDKSFAGGGNAGLLDQVEALRWVQRNIRSFGGDARNVTAFGESAGGESVRILLGTPQAQGLFHKAVIQSGINNLMDLSPATAKEMTRTLMKAVGAKTIKGLQRVKARDLAVKGENAGVFTGPHLDGHAFKTAPQKLIDTGRTGRIPLLIGTNLDEMRYWTAMCAAPGDESVTTKAMVKNVFNNKKMMKTYFGAKATSVVAAYRRTYGGDEAAVTTFLGDGNFRASSIRIAERHTKFAPTYMYLFGYRSPVKGRTGRTYGSTHSMELPFVFGTTAKPEVRAVTGPNAWGDLPQRTMDAWTAFARTGDPSTSTLRWPRYDTTHRATMSLDTTSKITHDPYATQRRAWSKVPFRLFPYPIPFDV